MSNTLSPLTSAEAAQLRACETIISKGIHAFNEVGNSLMRVRDGRLYRDRYSTFEEYCEARWQISRSRAYQLVDASETLSTIVDKINVPAPANEAQLRELAAVPEPERADVWQTVHERTEGKPTAAAVRAVRDERRPPSRPTETSASQPDPRPTVAKAIEYAQAHGAKPEEPHAAWRAKFAGAIAAAARIAGEFADEDIVTNADDALLGEWGRVIDTLTEKRGRVVAARTTPDNVRHLKAV